MKNFKNYLIGFGVVVLGIMIYRQFTDNTDIKYKELLGYKEKFEKLSEHSAKLEIQYAEEKQLKEKVERDWKVEKEHLNGRVRVLSESVFQMKNKLKQLEKPQYQGDNYVLQEIEFIDENGQVGPPIGYVMFFNDGKVQSKVYDFDLQINQLITRDDKTGKFQVIAKANYVLKEKPMEMTWLDIPYALPIKDGIALVDPLEYDSNDGLRFFNPMISGGFGIGVVGSEVETVPMISVNISSYGGKRTQPQYKLLNFGVGFGDELSLNFSPIQFRPFEKLMPNTYIGPIIMKETDGDTGYLIGVSINF